MDESGRENIGGEVLSQLELPRRRWHLRKVLEEVWQGAMWKPGVWESLLGWAPVQRPRGRNLPGMFSELQGGHCGWEAGGVCWGWRGYSQRAIRGQNSEKPSNVQTTESHVVAALEPRSSCSTSWLCHWALAPGNLINEESGAQKG